MKRERHSFDGEDRLSLPRRRFLFASHSLHRLPLRVGSAGPLVAAGSVLAAGELLQAGGTDRAADLAGEFALEIGELHEDVRRQRNAAQLQGSRR